MISTEVTLKSSDVADLVNTQLSHQNKRPNANNFNYNNAPLSSAACVPSLLPISYPARTPDVEHIDTVQCDLHSMTALIADKFLPSDINDV